MRLEKLAEVFIDGIQEENYYQIGNIFFFLKAKRTYLTLHYSDQEYKGRIIRVEEGKILLSCRNFQEGSERKAGLTFEALNRYYYCDALVLQTFRGGVIHIQFPPYLKHLIRRLYHRISFDDLFMRFITLYSPILEDRAEERALENKYPHFFQEIKEDRPSLRVMYQMIVSEIHKVSRKFTFEFSKKKRKEDFSLLEKMVFLKKKSILIEDTSRIQAYTAKFDHDALFSYSEYYENLVQRLGEKEADAKFVEIQKEDLKDFSLSYFISPLTIFNRVMGYLKIETNIFDKHSINAYHAVELVRLIELFSYSLTKIRIANSHFDASTIKTRIVNISLSGLLMEIQDKQLFEYLKQNKRIKMMIPVMGEELEVYAEIIRFFPKDEYYYLGVLFFKTKPGDMIKLENYLYENTHYQFF